MEKSLVLGASGLVGGHIVRHLSKRMRPYGLSREVRTESGVEWIKGDLANPQSVAWPDVEIIYCTASARLLADALPYMLKPSLKRVVLFTTTSISTKTDSPDPEERAGIAAYEEAERDLISCCGALGVKWTVLRPTLIYEEGKDKNITLIARIIADVGFLPLCGRARGLRQPVHAEDCAIAAISAASTASTEDKIYDLPGGETITYSEMIGRIFDGMGRPRFIIPVPPLLWMTAFHFAQHRFPPHNQTGNGAANGEGYGF